MEIGVFNLHRGCFPPCTHLSSTYKMSAMKNLIKLFAFIAFLGLAIFPAYGFASSNSGPKASGEGVGVISGWTVSEIKYQLSSDSALVSGVSFELDGAAGTVSVKLNSSSTQYTNCINTNGYHWQCDFPAGIGLADMDELQVIAVGD